MHKIYLTIITLLVILMSYEFYSFTAHYNTLLKLNEFIFDKCNIGVSV
jgi:hypothetical protein